MTITECILSTLLIMQSALWISVDFRRFCRKFDEWADR